MNATGVQDGQPQEAFNLEIPEFFNFAYDVIDRRAEKNRNHLAMVWVNESGEEKRFTFRDISEISNQIANLLRNLGIGKEDHVLLILPRVPEWWLCVLGILKLRAIFVPSAVSLTSGDIEYRCRQANIRAIIGDAENIEKIDSIRNKISTVRNFISIHKAAPGWVDFHAELKKASSEFKVEEEFKKTKSSDPMLLYFTSGTSGNPKMVMHRHSYALAHRVTAELWHALRKNDIGWTITDTGWAKMAWGALFGHWICGATIFVYDYKGRFDTVKILTLIQNYGVTRFCAPPTAYRMLVQEDLSRYNFSKLDHCMSAGEPLNAEVIETWKKKTGLEIYEGYGQTETVCLIAMLRNFPIKYGSMGKPTPLFEVDVLDDNAKPVPVMEEGNIAVKIKPERPPGIFDGYLNDESANREAFVGDWYLTGDRAYKDEEGYYWFVGRRDDVIKCSGYRIGPFEVESALITHDAVLESAVVGVPDEKRGQRVKAFVVLTPEYSGSEELVQTLQEHVRGITAPYKYPREVVFVDSLPKTISGKIKRKELKGW